MYAPREEYTVEKLFYRNREINKIGFWGLGRSNLGLLYRFKDKYPYLEFTLRADAPPKSSDAILNNFAEIRLGEAAGLDFYEDAVFFSPSVRRERFRVPSSEIIFSSDAEYFTENTRSDVFAITGSDGKSTTVTLCSMLLSAVYRDAFAIGNIGEAMTPFLDKSPDTAAVCELSSFQLSYFSPSVKRSLITNITPNHLNWHSSFSEYISAKENIHRNSREAVLNADCPVASEIGKKYPLFSVYSAAKDITQIKSEYNSEHYVYVKNNTIFHNGHPLLDIGGIACRGNHNVNNYIAAVAMCCDMPIEEALVKTAKTFTGLPHRCQTVAKINGIEFINSSIDSSPQRTQTTLSSLPDGLTVILGGKGKGLGFDSLIPILLKKAKAIFLTGETGKEISDLLTLASKRHSVDIAFSYFENFDDAVLSAAKGAKSGDRVILSPASTSFDRFSSFEERGEHFTKLINSFFEQ